MENWVKSFNIESVNLRFRDTKEEDLNFVLEAENHPENRDFISQWSIDKHRETMASDTAFHVMCETVSDSRKIGYMIIFNETEPPHCNIKLQRIVVPEKGKGHGREILQLLKKQVFEEMKIHRLWLDVHQKNARARHLYESEGFLVEGMWRECMLTQNGYESVLIMSILEEEYYKS